MYGIALKLTAFAIVRERESGTIEALLVTPIRPIELMFGKMIPNLCVAVLNLVLTFSVGMLIFGVPFRGSLLLFSALGQPVCHWKSGFGIGNLFRFSESGAGESIGIADEYRGHVRERFYVSALRTAAGSPRLLGYIMPMTFFLPIVNGIITKGVGLNDLWTPVLSLTALTVDHLLL